MEINLTYVMVLLACLLTYAFYEAEHKFLALLSLLITWFQYSSLKQDFSRLPLLMVLTIIMLLLAQICSNPGTARTIIKLLNGLFVAMVLARLMGIIPPDPQFIFCI